MDDAVKNHVDDKNNPHDVTAEQVGAATKPITLILALSSSSWSASGNRYTQSVTATGVTANETDHLIIISPDMESQEDYYAAGVYASAQSADTITFTASEQPTSTLTVYAVIQEV